MKPITDKFMIYDSKKHRYVLTSEAIAQLGINIESRMAQLGVPSAIVINRLVDKISMRIYSYLYRFNDSKCLQFLIAFSPSAREIVKLAMEEQAEYLFTLGDLSLVADEQKQKINISPQSREILDNQIVDETGVPLTYMGGYGFVPPPYSEGEY